MDIHLLAASCQEQLQKYGYAILADFVTSDDLEELRLEADTVYELAQEGQWMSSAAAGPKGLATAAGSGAAPHWGQDAVQSCIFETLPGHCCTPQLRTDPAAFAVHRRRWPLRGSVWRLLFQSRLTALVTALLGSKAVLFNEQYILKPPGEGANSVGTSFRWHRDSDWCSKAAAYQPYISVWCALDDATAANGCLVVQPGSHRRKSHQQQQPLPPQQQQSRQQHEQQEGQPPCGILGPTDQAPSVGECSGVPLEVSAGNVIITSDSLLHASGPNSTPHFRRAWMPQFASEPLTWRKDGAPVSLAIPLSASASL